jgi:hypothetical protein
VQKAPYWGEVPYLLFLFADVVDFLATAAFFFTGAFGDTQDFVKISFCHDVELSLLNNKAAQASKERSQRGKCIG